MTPARLSELFRTLDTVVRSTRDRSLSSRETVTTTLPNVLDPTEYHGFTVAEVLAPTKGISPGTAAMLYEQVCWWKLVGDLDRASVQETARALKNSLGKHIEAMIRKEKNGHRSVMLLLWAISKSADIPLTLDDHNGHLAVGPTTIGVVDGQLASIYIKDHVVEESPLLLLTEPVRTCVRNSSQFVTMLAATRVKPQDNGFAKLALMVLGSTLFGNKFDLATQTKKAAGFPSRKRLHERCVKFIANPAVHPVLMLKAVLVPQVVSARLFTNLFGTVDESRLPGVVKRRKLQKTIDDLFFGKGKLE